jgi:hypothetical protein
MSARQLVPILISDNMHEIRSFAQLSTVANWKAVVVLLSPFLQHFIQSVSAKC